jgi:molybdopterin molybdotransferase
MFISYLKAAAKAAIIRDRKIRITMISYNEARELIDKEFENLDLPIEETELENSLNRTLAENVYADVNLPPFNNSAVDGIAVKFNGSIKEWNIAGEISAGNYSDIKIDETSAVIIMTGAKVPDFCDTVIPLEDYIVKENKIFLNKDARFKSGMNIRKQASDVKEGEFVLQKGLHLNPRNIAAAASCGKSKLKVYSKLKFAVLATGDELIDVNEKPSGDKIRISNTFGLCSAIEELWQTSENLGFIVDDRETLTEKIKNILNSEIDILITTGGVSVGKFDYLKDVFAELGVKEIFWRAYIKPGKPAYFGKYEKKGKSILVFGLPGNPVSCMVNFDVYIRPNIITKYHLPKTEIISAILENDIRKNDKKRHFIRGNIRKDNSGGYLVTSKISQSSGNLVGFSSSNCLIIIEEEKLSPKKGEVVKCIMI